MPIILGNTLGELSRNSLLEQQIQDQMAQNVANRALAAAQLGSQNRLGMEDIGLRRQLGLGQLGVQRELGLGDIGVREKGIEAQVTLGKLPFEKMTKAQEAQDTLNKSIFDLQKSQSEIQNKLTGIAMLGQYSATPTLQEQETLNKMNTELGTVTEKANEALKTLADTYETYGKEHPGWLRAGFGAITGGLFTGEDREAAERIAGEKLQAQYPNLKFDTSARRFTFTPATKGTPNTEAVNQIRGLLNLPPLQTVPLVPTPTPNAPPGTVTPTSGVNQFMLPGIGLAPQYNTDLYSGAGINQFMFPSPGYGAGINPYPPQFRSTGSPKFYYGSDGQLKVIPSQ